MSIKKQIALWLFRNQIREYQNSIRKRREIYEKEHSKAQKECDRLSAKIRTSQGHMSNKYNTKLHSVQIKRACTYGKIIELRNELKSFNSVMGI